jgi:hypothetical protein
MLTRRAGDSYVNHRGHRGLPNSGLMVVVSLCKNILLGGKCMTPDAAGQL